MNIRFDPAMAEAADAVFAWRHEQPADALVAPLCELYCNEPERRAATLALPFEPSHEDAALAFAERARAEGIVDEVLRGDGCLLLTTLRKTFWQRAQPWMMASASSETPLAYAQSNGCRHPVRPKNAPGVIYERHFPQIDMTFSLRTVDPDRDAAVFSEWQNQDRVAHFWEQKGTLEEHRAYLAERLADPHMHPTLGCFDGKPFGYFEFYWAKEDRLGPFYDAGDFDRGLHLLIGDTRFQSAGKLKAWWSGVLHYMFIDEPRTQRLVGEPRVDHVRHIAYMHRMGFYTLKEFDFPHKRAALTVMERAKFFEDFRF